MRHKPADRPQDEVLLHDPKGRGKFWGVAFGAFLAGAMTTFVYFTRFVGKAPVPADPSNGEAQVAAQPPASPTADKISLGRGVGVKLEAFGKGELPGGLGALIKAFTQKYGTLHINQSVEGNPLRIGKEQFTNGLGTHSTSKIRLELGGKYKALSGLVGADAETIGTIVFKIANDKGAVPVHLCAHAARHVGREVRGRRRGIAVRGPHRGGRRQRHRLRPRRLG